MHYSGDSPGLRGRLIRKRSFAAKTHLATWLVAALFLACIPGAPAQPGQPSGDALSSLVDSEPEEIKFRFRTRFTRVYEPDQDARVLIARKTATPPILDGVLEDACWKGEGPQHTWKHRTQSAFVAPTTTDISPKQTVLYVCYDERNLYVALVAEEPELKTTHFVAERDRRSLERFGGPHGWEAINGDSGELFIETDGFGGDGHVWQFIFNLHPHMLYDGHGAGTIESVKWESGARNKGAMGPNRWIVELAIPFSGFKYKGYAYQAAPLRGERWGIRTARNGRPSAAGEMPFMSTWTYNPTRGWHNPWPTGALIFEDPNLLLNGRFNEDLDQDGKLDHWKLQKSREALDATLAFDEQEGFGAVACVLAGAEDVVQVSQTVAARPNKFYRLKGKLKIAKGRGKVTVGIEDPGESVTLDRSGEWQDVDLEVLSTRNQEKLVAYMMLQQGVEKVLIDHLSIQQMGFGVKKGVYCLTGNSSRPEYNVRDAWNIQGRYTHLDPQTRAFVPPYRKVWSDWFTNGYEDLGAESAQDGWISFAKGSLTKGGHNLVQWPYPYQPRAKTYPSGHETIIDLGRDFFVTGIDALFSSPVENMHVYVKPEKSDTYFLVKKLKGAGVLHPRESFLYCRERDINSVARYVKLHWMEDGLAGGGIYFAQVWGQKKGEHGDLEVSRFRWKDGITMKKPVVPSFRRIREPFIVPRPRAVEWTDTPFVCTESTKIACASAGYTPGIGRDFADDIFEMQQVRLPVVSLEEEIQTNPSLKNCIVIGDVANSSELAGVAKRAGIKISPEDPGQEGYVLTAGPDRVLIIGSGEDQQGAFYGVGSVMQIIRRDAERRLIIPGCRIRDWPNLKIRGTFSLSSDEVRLRDEYKRVIKLLGMLRVNTMLSYGTGDVFKFDRDSPSEVKAYEDLRDFIRRHYITWGLLGGTTRGHGRFLTTEMADDEDEKHIRDTTNRSRINMCPSSSHAYFTMRNLLDRSIYDSLSDAEVYSLPIDEMYQVNSGSRWNADRRCLRRRLSGARLFHEHICRNYDLTRRRGVKLELINNMLTTDARQGKFQDFYTVYPYIPRDVAMICWVGLVGKSGSDPEYAADKFERTYTMNNFGFNGNYGDPYGGPNPDFKQKTGRRIGGAMASWWRSGENESMVLGFLSKYEYTSVPILAEYLWSPADPMPNTLEFANRLVNLTVRMNERYHGRFFPSWQEDRNPGWFKVDLSKVVNWSHIDDEPSDGKGWLDWGSNYDLRLMPMGHVTFEEVPFHIIDPKINQDRSIVFLANYHADSKLVPPLPSRAPEIPIGRKVASLCFLKMRVGAGTPATYAATYEGGRVLTFNLDVRGIGVAGRYAWDRPHSYETINQYGKSIGSPNPLAGHIDFVSRPGWLGYATSGDECSARIHEWVNPYPELLLRSISVYYPSCQTSSERTAILAISGIESEPQDRLRWSAKAEPPFRPARDPVSLEGLEPLFAGGKPEVLAETRTDYTRTGRRISFTGNFVDDQSNVLFSVSGGGVSRSGQIFQDDEGSCILIGTQTGRRQWDVFVDFEKPATVEALALRGRFMTFSAASGGAGAYRLARADYRVQVHSPDGQWTPVGELPAVCGEDDTYYLAVPSLTIDRIRVEVDISRHHRSYYGRYRSGNTPGFSYLQAYVRGKD